MLRWLYEGTLFELSRSKLLRWVLHLYCFLFLDWCAWIDLLCFVQRRHLVYGDIHEEIFADETKWAGHRRWRNFTYLPWFFYVNSSFTIWRFPIFVIGNYPWGPLRCSSARFSEPLLIKYNVIHSSNLVVIVRKPGRIPVAAISLSWTSPWYSDPLKELVWIHGDSM